MYLWLNVMIIKLKLQVLSKQTLYIFTVIHSKANDEDLPWRQSRPGPGVSVISFYCFNAVFLSLPLLLAT